MRQCRSALALLDLPLTLCAGALWWARPELGPWPLLLIAIGWVTRRAACPRTVRNFSGLDAAVALFGLSAGLGLAVAYDPVIAAQKFWSIVGGIALYGALRRAPADAPLGRWTVRPAEALLGVLPSAVAAYYILSADYSLLTGKFPPLDPLYRTLLAVSPGLPLDSLHSNVAGGLIAVLLPLQLAALRGRRATFVLVPLSLLGLALSLSRGAWLALFAVAAVAAVLVSARAARLKATVAAGAAGAVLALLLTLPPLAVAEARAAPPTPTSTPHVAASGQLPELAGDNPKLFTGFGGRFALYRHSAALARDYAFTGLGLGGFPMAFSSYMLLVHVGHTMHSHNLFLDVWLEMGLPGAASLLWLIGAALVAAARAWRGDQAGRAWTAAALAAVAVLCLHGLVDDAQFASRGAFFMFAPFAILARGQAAALARAGEPPLSVMEVLSGRTGLIGAGLLIALLVLSLLPSTRSQWQANLGALYQTRVELSAYDWPEWPIQDALRRVPAYNIDPALERYRAALALNAANGTANRRLGQILLSRGEYGAAGALLATARSSGYANRAEQQLYGEWLAISGRGPEAAAVWRTLDLNQGQIEARAWWYDRIGESDRADAIRLAAAMTREQ